MLKHTLKKVINMKDVFFGQDFQLLQWIFALLLSGLGFISFKLLMFSRRTLKVSHFNPYYWWKDNRNEFYLGLIMFYVLMRFHSDIVVLLNDKFNFPFIENRFLYVFTFGLLFTLILKKARSFFNIRMKEYSNGATRD